MVARSAARWTRLSTAPPSGGPALAPSAAAFVDADTLAVFSRDPHNLHLVVSHLHLAAQATWRDVRVAGGAPSTARHAFTTESGVMLAGSGALWRLEAH